MQEWQYRRARNVSRVVPGRLVVYNAYWPTYGIDAGMYAWVLTGIDPAKEEVQCYFFAARSILWLPLRDFELCVARCLDYADLRTPRKPVVPFAEQFGPLTFDAAQYRIDVSKAITPHTFIR